MNNKISSNIPEPTEKEINEAILSVKSKYDVIIPRDEATLYVKLTKEFNWWFELEQASDSSLELKKELTDEIKNEVKTKGSKVITDVEAKSLLTFRIQKEKRRTSEAAGAIIAKYLNPGQPI